MDIKIYADTTTGFLHFDGSRISPKPLNGVVAASASNRAFRIRITRSDLLQANGNPRIMFKHLRMTKVANEAGQNLRTDLGYNRAQIIDYINAEAQKVVEAGIDGISVCLNGSVVSTAATTLDFTGSAVQDLVVSAGIATVTIAQTTGGGGGGSYSDSDVDTHVNVGTANTDDVLTYDGSDYQWRAPSTLSGNAVVRGLVTGIGNTTLRLVMTDSSTIDIDASTLNTGSPYGIDNRVTKAVSFARTETSFLRYSVGSASNNMWDAAFRTPGSTPLGMGSAADTHVSNDGNAQPFSQTLIFRNAGINTDRDSVLVGISDGDEADILASGVVSHYIGISSTNKLVHHWGEPHILGIGTTQANRAELMDVQDDTWYGIFFDFDGQRFATGVTTSQLNSQFRYKVVDLSNGDVTDLTPNWTHYGKSQNGNSDSRVYSRLMYGALAGTNNDSVSASNVHLRFEGDIAQASSISYQQGAVLLDDTQVGLMVRDPEKYLRDYKVGTSSRRPYFDTTQLFKVSFANYHFQAAQVWLMGDGDYDSLGSSSEQGVRNFVRPDAYMRLNWPSYPSYTGFTTVSIPGLS